MKFIVSSPGDPPTHPDRPVESPPGTARPRWRWADTVRWALVSILGAFACLIFAAVAVIGLYATPLRAVLPWPNLLTQRTNVLIMGLDRTVSDRDPHIVYPVSRTDTLIAASFDPASRRVYLLSVPRDTRAAIPRHGTTKINAAHAYGGVPLTIRTAENFLGVRFPYYIAMRERGFVHLIDAVGGVDVRIEKDLNYDDSWDGLHIHLKKGYRRLGGKAAMEYARFRHDPLGDIGRIKRQQEVMRALLEELRRPRIVTRLPRVLRVFHEDVATNLPEAQLITLALFGARLPPGGVVRETLPGSFAEDWIPDIPRDREIVARMFYGVDAETLAHTTAEIFTTPANRAVTDAIARVTALGIRLVRVTITSSDPAAAVILHRGDPRVAGIVAALVGAQTIMESASTSGPDLTVILADDALVTPASMPPQ